MAMSPERRRAGSARMRRNRVEWDDSIGPPLELRPQSALFNAELIKIREERTANLDKRLASEQRQHSPKPRRHRTQMSYEEKEIAVDDALEETVQHAFEGVVKNQVGDTETAGALQAPGNEAVAASVAAMQAEAGFAPPQQTVHAVQGWRLADMLKSVDLRGEVAFAMTAKLRRSVEGSGGTWDASMELNFAKRLSASGGLAQGILRDIRLHSVLSRPIAQGLTQLGPAPTNSDGGGAEAPPPNLSGKFVDDGAGAVPPPQVRISFRVVHTEGRSAELAPDRYRKSLCAAFGVTEAEVTLPRLVRVVEDHSMPLLTRCALWGGPDAPDTVNVATYEVSVIALPAVVQRVSDAVNAATFADWVRWLSPATPRSAVTFGLTLDTQMEIAEYQKQARGPPTPPPPTHPIPHPTPPHPHDPHARPGHRHSPPHHRSITVAGLSLSLWSTAHLLCAGAGARREAEAPAPNRTRRAAKGAPHAAGESKSVRSSGASCLLRTP